MRKEGQTWHEYISEASSETIYDTIRSQYDKRLSKYYEALDQLRQAYLPLFNRLSGPVKYRNTAIVVLKKELPAFKGRDKYGNYGFIAQCLATGSRSKWIQVEEYDKYGINSDWQEKGGPYMDASEFPQVDNMKPILDFYFDQYGRILSAMQSRASKYEESYREYYQQLNHEWFRRYNEYLYSNEWRTIRGSILSRDLESCLNCGDTASLQVHHITYDNVGQELNEDLITLCKSCHIEIHNVDYDTRKLIESNCINLIIQG